MRAGLLFFFFSLLYPWCQNSACYIVGAQYIFTELKINEFELLPTDYVNQLGNTVCQPLFAFMN